MGGLPPPPPWGGFFLCVFFVGLVGGFSFLWPRGWSMMVADNRKIRRALRSCWDNRETGFARFRTRTKEGVTILAAQAPMAALRLSA